MEIEQTKIKLAKILRLAERGVGGEKSNAQAILAKMLKQHNLTIDDLVGGGADVLKWKGYSYRTKIEQRLLFQCVAKITNASEIHSRQIRGRRELRFEMCELDHLELSNMFSYYKKLLNKELDILFRAFIHRHDLFSNQKSGNKASEADIAEAEQILKMMRGMRKSNYVSTRRQLEPAKSA